MRRSLEIRVALVTGAMWPQAWDASCQQGPRGRKEAPGCPTQPSGLGKPQCHALDWPPGCVRYGGRGCLRPDGGHDRDIFKNSNDSRLPRTQNSQFLNPLLGTWGHPDLTQLLPNGSPNRQ
jgi:hypothetical protein